MKRYMIAIVSVILTIVFVLAIGLGVFLYIRFAPNNERVNLSEWFQVDGDEVAIMLDNEVVPDVKALVESGQVYLPIEWVNESLNDRFYWSDADEQLLYTLPDEIIYADLNTKGTDGNPLLLNYKQGIWIRIGLLATYTDISIELFVEDEVKRVFIDTDWKEALEGTAKKNTEIRVEPDNKSKVIIEVEKDTKLLILEEEDDWTKVRTEDGFVGYLKRNTYKDVEEKYILTAYQEPDYTNITMDEPVTLVFHQVTLDEANNYMEEMMADTKGVNVIAPTWFMLTDNEGNYHSYADRDYVEAAHDLGLQVWPTIDNFNMGENVQSEILFADSEARQKLINQLMDDVEYYGIDGINVDIEGIKPEAGPHFVQFVRELSIACRENTVVLSVDLYVPSEYTEFYNRKEIGIVADYLVVMGYDEHFAGGDMGSVASIGFVEKGVQDTIADVPPEKTILAIPFYTRVWKEGEDKVTSSAVGIQAAKNWVEEHDVELTWNEALGQYYGETRIDGINQYIWMEEERSLELKMEVARDYELAGTAFWKLGLESEESWDVIEKIK